MYCDNSSQTEKFKLIRYVQNSLCLRQNEIQLKITPFFCKISNHLRDCGLNNPKPLSFYCQILTRLITPYSSEGRTANERLPI